MLPGQRRVQRCEQARLHNGRDEGLDPLPQSVCHRLAGDLNGVAVPKRRVLSPCVRAPGELTQRALRVAMEWSDGDSGRLFVPGFQKL